MKYNILFLDVDGTLKQEPHGISETNKNAIIRALEADKKISIATGRNRDLILRTIDELKLSRYAKSYTIALNGAHIIENSEGRTLSKTQIPLDLTRILFEKAYELKIACHVYTENLIYFSNNDSHYDWYKRQGCTCKLIDMKDTHLGMLEEPLKFYLFCKDKIKLRKYSTSLEEIIKGQLKPEYSTEFTLEYTSVNASKGLGVKYICDLADIDISTAIAVGDGENDISMIKMAGLGIAMKNALDSVKLQADIVTERSCMENGLEEIITTYLLDIEN